MHSVHNSGDVILQFGQTGLTFSIASETPLTFANPISKSKPWTRFLASFFVSIGLWSLPMFTHAATFTGQDLVEKTNQIRIEHGLPAVTTNPLLEQAALTKANDMFARQYFDHTTPSGQSPWIFFSQAGYRFTSAGENLALEPKATADPVAAWMLSSGHRQNILNPKFRDIGVAIISGTFAGAPTTFIVQFFGSRRAGATVPPPLPVSISQPIITPPSPKPLIAPIPAVMVPALAAPSATENPPFGMPLATLMAKPSVYNPSSVMAEVLGATTQVIPTAYQDKNFAPNLSWGISTLVIEVMGFYLCLIAAIGVFQTGRKDQNTTLDKPVFRLAA